MRQEVDESSDSSTSVSDQKPTSKPARFLLEPFVDNPDEAAGIPLIPLLSEIISHKLIKSPSKVFFKGWKLPHKKWKQWVEQLVTKHEATWNKAGIFEAIISSTYEIPKHPELILGLLEFWCSETNTFVFPWGEATMTLEDMLILGGFSVLGESVYTPLTTELEKMKERLIKKRRKFSRTTSKKATHTVWMNKFMEKKGELEHVAFLSLWLSRYVFPARPEETITFHVFPIAIHLSQGTRLALAPAVLTSLYMDLRLLQTQIVESNDFEFQWRKTQLKKIAAYEHPYVWAPFQLMQLWIWERFPILAPKILNSPRPGEPRVARWQNLNSPMKLRLIRAMLISPENFKWRPYAAVVHNWRFPAFYKDKEQTVDGSATDDELRSFARCLRACELVGLDSVEQYHPHRVAMQFGLDQHFPAHLPRADDSKARFWDVLGNYNMPIAENASFYIPPRQFQPKVTIPYSEWWQQSMLARKDTIKNALLLQKSRKNGTVLSSSSSQALSDEEKEESRGSSSPGFPFESGKQSLHNSTDDDKPISVILKHPKNPTNVAEVTSTADKPYQATPSGNLVPPVSLVTVNEMGRKHIQSSADNIVEQSSQDSTDDDKPISVSLKLPKSPMNVVKVPTRADKPSTVIPSGNPVSSVSPVKVSQMGRKYSGDIIIEQSLQDSTDDDKPISVSLKLPKSPVNVAKVSTGADKPSLVTPSGNPVPSMSPVMVNQIGRKHSEDTIAEQNSQDSADDDKPISVSLKLPKSPMNVAKVPTRADKPSPAIPSENRVSSVSPTMVNQMDRKQRQFTISKDNIVDLTMLVELDESVGEEVNNKTGNSADDINGMSKKHTRSTVSMDSVIEITESVELEESVGKKAKKKKAVGDSADSPFDIDEFYARKKSKTSKLQEPDLESRVLRLERLMGLIPNEDNG